MFGPTFGDWMGYIPGYGPRLLAFLDVLGWEELTKRPDPTMLDRVASCQHLIEKSLNRTAPPEREPGWSLFESQFSDTLIFSCVPAPSEVSLLIERIREFCAMLLFEGYYTRGAIAVGNARHDATAVFGPAMVEAYRLEKAAVYPRVLVSDGAAPLLEGAMLDDFDGLRILDLVGYWGVKEARELRAQVAKEIEKTRDLAQYHDPSIALNHRAKYGWLLRHLDRSIEEQS